MQVQLDSSRHLSEDIRERMKMTFKVLDGDRDGKLDKEEAATLFRGLGQNPRDAEWEDIAAQEFPSSGLVSFDDFCGLFKKHWKYHAFRLHTETSMLR